MRRTLAILGKTLREQSRDLWLLALTVAAAPFFIVLYWAFFGGTATTYGLIVVSGDVAAVASPSSPAGPDGLVQALADFTNGDGNRLFKVVRVDDRSEAERRLANREAAAALVIPEGFSRSLASWRQSGGTSPPTTVTIIADLTNPQYLVAGPLADAIIDDYCQRTTGWQRPVRIDEVPLGISGQASDIDTYTPGLIIFSVIMLIFPASMSIARETEAGTQNRLRLSRLTSLQYLAGMSGAQVLIGLVSVILSLATAKAVGFHSQGPLWVAVLLGGVTAVSVVGVGLIVAAFSRSTNEAFVLANFPLMLLMFFSGSIFPISKVTLFKVAGRTIGLFDLLPPTHAVVALNKVLTQGFGLGQLGYELGALVILSTVYFAAGVILFQRRQMSKAAV